jgi:spore coat polysaccharide biosynthesis protein SpsF
VSSVVALITARLKSSRLPRKAFLPIDGKPLLDHLLERLQRMDILEGIILCTSELPDDEPLVEWAIGKRIGFLRGNAVDVLDRMRLAARFAGAEDLFCVTGDNPFVSPEHGSDLMRFHRGGGFDFTATKGIPIGAYGYALSAVALERACHAKASEETEIWGPYFTRGNFKCGVFDVPSMAGLEKMRLTVDTPEDYVLACRLAKDLGRSDFSLADVESWAGKNEGFSLSNRHVIQRPPPEPRFRNAT